MVGYLPGKVEVGYPQVRLGRIPPDIRPGSPWTSNLVIPLLVRSGGDHWRPIQTGSFGDPLTPSNIWW